MSFLRALPHRGNGTNDKDAIAVAGALLDVFAHAGKVNQLLCTLAGLDLGSSSVDSSNVVRENSSLTNMFKVFFHRFGRGYYDAVLKEIIGSLDEAGDLGLINPKNCQTDRIKELLFNALEKVIQSSQFVAPQIRQMASVLMSVTALRFNSKKTTYNGLSGFFFTRFVSSIIANPASFDDEFRSRTEKMSFLTKVAIPFSQMIQIPLNLYEFRGKFEPFESWNRQLNDGFMPRLFDFVMQLAELPPEDVIYEKPSADQLTRSLESILDWTVALYQPFSEKYNELRKNPTVNPPISWSVGTYFFNLFADNADDSPEQN
jgi:hypothetical protein